MIEINFHKPIGKIKPMNGVNNGPTKEVLVDQVRGNFIAFKEARIPYARNHDAAFSSTYGGEHTVDISAIFPNFDADEQDEKNYDFFYTDEYVKNLLAAGTETFFRLGEKIEHGIKKYGTLVPKDYAKWARICEHVILHYNFGWANGFTYNIQYWEIWNEPDLDADNAPNKRTWSGTKAQFFDFYEVAAKYLKEKFPTLQIGGPALAYNLTWAEEFLQQMQKRNVPIDFFSWHIYACDPMHVVSRAQAVRTLLNNYGYVNTATNCNEWNYIEGWTDEYVSSIKAIISERGAAFTAAVMNECQLAPVDMLMYYDARLNTCLNGMFDFYTLEPLKGYYPFYVWGKLAALENSVECVRCDPRVSVTAAAKGDKAGFMLVFYDADKGNTKAEEIKIQCNGLQIKKGEVYLTDRTHSFEKTSEFTGAQLTLSLLPNTVVFVSLNEEK